MAKFYNNPIVKVATVDLTDHIASIEISESRDEIETTAFGQTARTRIAGLADNSVTISFHEDYAATEVWATLRPLIGGTAALEVWPTGSTAISATNPKATGNVLITEYTSGGAIGELAAFDVTWPVDGAITWATAN
jgi:hypothetical protein